LIAPFANLTLVDMATASYEPEPPSLMRSEPRFMGENDRARITLLTNGAAAHLSRANTLAQVEWNVTLLFWGALVTSGISFCAYASNSSPPLATYIARYDWVVLSAYMAASLVFLFGFSINQARSIVEVRSQYQRALNEAHRIASLEPIAKTGNSFPRDQIFRIDR
jgi:hypothetical protein